MPRYIDIHSHVNFTAFDKDRAETIERALSGDTWVINVGTQVDTSRKAVEMANQYKEGVYAIVGLHPIHTGASYHDEKELGEGGKEFTSRGEAFDAESYRELLKDPKVVGIGECGLDQFRSSPEDFEKQQDVFLKHIELANKVNKPPMLHVRNGKENKGVYKEAIAMLKEHAKVRANFHFFAGSVEDVKEILDINGSVSFTGVVTFARDYDEVVRYVPKDRILSETDAPYASPIPYRGKRNEPVYVKEIVAALAQIRGEREAVFSKQLIDNARNLFSI